MLEDALNDKNRHSVFIEVRNKSYTYIVENAKCYKTISNESNISFDDYKRQMLNSFRKHNIFQVDIETPSDDWKRVHNKFSYLRKEELHNRFFNEYGGIKRGVSDEIKCEIIQRLFHLNELCLIDCETGSLRIVKKEY